MSALSSNIKNFRLMREMSQKEFGEMLHKSPSVISNWESGTNSPDVELIPDMCRIFKCTPNELFGWDESKELENYLTQKLDMLRSMENLLSERDRINKQIKEYSSQLSRRR